MNSVHSLLFSTLLVAAAQKECSAASPTSCLCCSLLHNSSVLSCIALSVCLHFPPQMLLEVSQLVTTWITAAYHLCLCLQDIQKLSLWAADLLPRRQGIVLLGQGRSTNSPPAVCALPGPLPWLKCLPAQPPYSKLYMGRRLQQDHFSTFSACLRLCCILHRRNANVTHLHANPTP